MQGAAWRAARKMRLTACSDCPTTLFTTSGHSIGMKLAMCLAAGECDKYIDKGQLIQDSG